MIRLLDTARRLKRFLQGRVLEKFPRIRKLVRPIYKKAAEKIFAPLGWIENNYPKWLARNRLTQAQIKRINNEIVGYKYRPKISVIMPVFNVAPQWLKLAIASVEQQLYENWELCIVDDCSTNRETIELLRSIRHPNIKIQFSGKNRGICGASNTAMEMMTGEYVALMDNDDVITPDALYEVLKAINATDSDLIYSDEDKIDSSGVRSKPFFKPDWSPELLRSQNYICHLAVIKKSMVEMVDGFEEGTEGAQDHDLFLKITEKTNHIHHISKVLYSWREIKTSTASNPDSKPYAANAGLKAVDGHLKRHFQNNANCRNSPYRFVNDVRFPLAGEPMVSIIIPTKDAAGYLRNCIHSIVTRSTYSKYEILILNNNSETPETEAYFDEVTTSHPHIRVIDAFYPFCWSRLNNHGISEANGDAFIFLNNDTQVISRDWMERLVEQAIRDDVGTVGPLMLYEDGTIQHAGVVVGLGGWADHVFKGMLPDHVMSPFVSPMVKRNVLAVTGSCMAVSRETLNAVGGFDERFMVCGSDVALCLAAYEKGFHNIYDPFVRLYHFESKTRIPDDIPSCDFEMSKIYYKKYLENGDPFFNVNLSLAHTTPTIREPE